MPNQNPLKLPLKRLQAAVDAARASIIPKMGTIAVNFTLENFEKQGFQGQVFEPWKERKKETKKTTGKKILTLTARLRNATRFDIIDGGVRIHNNVPYAQIHNEGGTIKHTSREHIMNFGRKKGGGLQLAKIQTIAQRKKIVAQAKTTIGAHETHIPKRQFIGYSPVLNDRIEPMIIAEILKNYKTV